MMKIKIYKKQKEVENYFNEHNYGFSGRHKVDYARYKIYKIFDKWYFEPNAELNFDKFIDDLIAHKDYLKMVKNHFVKETEKENRNLLRKTGKNYPSKPKRGWDTYGFKNLQGDFAYINDRWTSADRIQWMIDAIHYYNVERSIVPHKGK